jgi:hypothetical protein
MPKSAFASKTSSKFEKFLNPILQFTNFLEGSSIYALRTIIHVHTVNIQAGTQIHHIENTHIGESRMFLKRKLSKFCSRGGVGEGSMQRV